MLDRTRSPVVWYKDRDFPEIKISNAEIVAVVEDKIQLQKIIDEHNAELLGYGVYLDECVRKARTDAFEEAVKYVRWKMEALGKDIHPAAKVAYEEAIRTIQTADMPRSVVDDMQHAGEDGVM